MQGAQMLSSQLKGALHTHSPLHQIVESYIYICIYIYLYVHIYQVQMYRWGIYRVIRVIGRLSGEV